MFECHYDELINYLTRITGNRDAAAEITQETFVRVLESQATTIANMDVHNPRALLFKTARNIAVDQHRKMLVRKHENIDDVVALAHSANEPDTIAEGRQQIDAIFQTIDGLPPRCREAFVLYKLEGLPQAIIARQMGISLNMVEKHIGAGMLACKKCLLG